MHTFTVIHVIISLVGIASGFVVIAGFITSKKSNPWTNLFLWSTILTSVTGFFFPYRGFTPALGFGIVSLVVLALTFFAIHRRLAGHWRWIYVLTALFAQYLNFFVLIVQSFQKIPLLNALAPTQTEPSFALAQGFALLLFIVLGTMSVRRFRNVVPVSGL